MINCSTIGAFLTILFVASGYGPSRMLLTQGSALAMGPQVESASTDRWQPNPDRGTATSTLSGGRQGARPSDGRDHLF